MQSAPVEELTLSDAQIGQFHELGFLTLPSVTTPTEVVGLQESYDRLFEAAALVADEDRFQLAGTTDAPTLSQVMNPDRYAPELLLTLAYRNAVRVAHQLLGDRVTFEGMHAIRKPPRHGAATPWHQDQAYWDPRFEHFGITVWVPLQPVSSENGCMQFVPRSHELGVQPHELIAPESHGLRLKELDVVEDVVTCPLPAGGATIHFCRTLHHAGPNTTDEPRRALIMDFKAPPEPLAEPRSMPWQRPEWME